jgi:hypothetical protein
VGSRAAAFAAQLIAQDIKESAMKNVRTYEFFGKGDKPTGTFFKVLVRKSGFVRLRCFKSENSTVWRYEDQVQVSHADFDKWFKAN